jgi:hypothetical protein
MGITLATALAAFLAAHAVLVAGLARAGAWRRAVLAFLVPPLAPWWGWSAGLRRPVMAWGAALVLYAAGVAVA